MKFDLILFHYLKLRITWTIDSSIHQSQNNEPSSDTLNEIPNSHGIFQVKFIRLEIIGAINKKGINMK